MKDEEEEKKNEEDKRKDDELRTPGNEEGPKEE
jgi:hypothetical protein